jgi:sirohydrochlorin cobaltochelatase
VKGIVLFGHGSRDPLWRAAMDAVAGRIAEQTPQVPVRCAFLELQEPGLAAAVADLLGMGVTAVVVVPMFLGTGRHVREDLPALVDGLADGFPGIAFELRPPVGEDARVVDLIAKIAGE